MPLYEYECQSCHQRIEVLQKFSDPPPATCASCGGALAKLVSAPAFHLKGSGWYATDYAKKSGSDKGSSGADAGGGGGEGSKADSPKAESSKADSPKADSPKAEGSKSESSKPGSSTSSAGSN